MKKFKSFDKFFEHIANVHKPKAFIVVEEDNKFFLKVDTLYGSINESYKFIARCNLVNFNVDEIIKINGIVYKLGYQETGKFLERTYLEVL